MNHLEIINTLAAALDTLLSETIDADRATGCVLTDSETAAQEKAMAALAALDDYRKQSSGDTVNEDPLPGGRIYCPDTRPARSTAGSTRE